MKKLPVVEYEPSDLLDQRAFSETPLLRTEDKLKAQMSQLRKDVEGIR